jgi:hypothetical protein
MKGLTTCVDVLPAYIGQEHILFLGAPENIPDLPSEKVTILAPVNEDLLHRISTLDFRAFTEGLIVVVASREYSRHSAVMDEAQRLLAYMLCKYVIYPKSSMKIPDPLSLRSEVGLDWTHEINKSRNTACFLRYPLADKLAGIKVGLPVLLCLPGPSLKELSGVLPDLAKKYLVVCLARSLSFCLEQGVEPDFIVQLDTYQRQRHFYPVEKPLANTYVAALSLSPVHAIVSRVRGVFFIDSFDLEVLPNGYRLRESWLSSLLACLGLCEALHAPRVVLAGADLCFNGLSERYCTPANKDTTSQVQAEKWGGGPVLAASNKVFTVPDNSGRKTQTVLPYWATSVEAEIFAREISQSVGSTFAVVGGQSVLRQEVFPRQELESLLEQEDMDKEMFRERTDHALAQHEDVNLLSLRIKLLKLEKQLSMAVLSLKLSLEQGGNDLDSNVLVQSAKILGSDAPGVPESYGGSFALGLVEEWLWSNTQAKNTVIFFEQVGKKKSVPLLCLPGEEEDMLEKLRIRPAWLFSIHHIAPDPGGSHLHLPGDFVSFENLFPWMSKQKVVLVSARLFQEYDYLFRTIPLNNWVVPEECGLC